MHSWDDFRYFYAVAQSGSFSKAAKDLGVNHSTVSRRIQSLEEGHGVRLFDRTHSGYVMTEAGASIFEIVEDLNHGALQASRVLLGQDARMEGKINLTMPHEVYEQCLIGPLKRYALRYPEIEINLMVSKGLRNLANREADVAVRITPSPPDYLIGKRFCNLQHGIYTRRDLATEEYTPIVVWDFEKAIPDWAKQYVDNPKIVLKVDDLSAMYQAVRAGCGMARMPCFMPDSWRDPAVKKLEVKLPPSDWGLWLLNHVDLKNTARINCLKKYLTEELSQLVPLFEGRLSLSEPL